MVIIRLARGGNRNRPFFFIVVTDSHSRRDGRFIEKIGFHNPINTNASVEAFRIDMARLNYWLSVGAQVSPTIKNLLKKHKAALTAAA